ncbi:hypothetical protein ABZ926_35500 [Streptomyces litmocidini]|uniref:Uncharacterized protein n=1 Tax=Streptomyces litmocidini TaxID=67318 RepID=A0ABW7UJR2_9ACTN|nr:hypothetical protein [Streptomyces sp. PanSC19]ROQ33394.1 hypothetical protein EDD98_2420 [Streptomyces sp. PanSC19]
MWTNTQFTGSLGPGATQSWSTVDWPASWHVVWYVVPTSPAQGAPQVDWDVAVERASEDKATYWITVKNLTSKTVTFEGRYAVLDN